MAAKEAHLSDSLHPLLKLPEAELLPLRRKSLALLWSIGAASAPKNLSMSRHLCEYNSTCKACAGGLLYALTPRLKIDKL